MEEGGTSVLHYIMCEGLFPASAVFEVSHEDCTSLSAPSSAHGLLHTSVPYTAAPLSCHRTFFDVALYPSPSHALQHQD